VAEVTDPDLLKQLNVAPAVPISGAAPNPAPSGLVTDPELLKKLNAGDSEKPSVAADVAKSGGIGLAKGVIAGLGAPGDLSNLLAKGSKIAGDYIGGKLGFEPSPELPQHSALDYLTSPGIQSAVESKTGEFYKPQTTAGKFAESAGEFAGNPTSYIGPGGILAKGATAIGAGVGSEAAGQLADANKSQYAPLYRLAGAIAGGHGVATTPRLVTPNIISPQRQAMLDVLRNENVPLTAGDRTGNTMVKAAESELSPGRNEAQRDAFNQAAFNRVGEAVGDRPIQGQNGAVDTMMRRIGGQFDGLVARNRIDADPQLVNDLQGIHRTYNDVPGLYPQETVNSINGSLRRAIDTISHNGGTLPGDEYQTLRSNLRAAAQGAADPQRAEGLHGVVNSLDDAMERTIQRTNPADAGVWPQARRDYRNALVLQRWAGSANMTPATLAQSAKAVYGKNQYVRGMDDFSDLAEAGRNVLPQYQDSGTARRLQVEGLMKGLGGVAGFGAGASHGMGAEGGVAGLLLGELAGPIVARPAARAALMNPVTQGIIANQALPFRVGTSPSTIALMNEIRGNQQARAKKNQTAPDAVRGGQ
jgi:hypothetical protein